MYSFSEIIGHENATENLKSAIIKSKLSHAYIINSKDSISRSEIAKAFAKTIQCTGDKKDACLSCSSCKAFDHNNHADVVYVDTKDKKSISIESIREEIVNDINIRPYNSEYKIYIIEDADKMTVSAQNALLKTIESPHSYVIIILLTENHNKMLDTILSRCILIDLKPLKEEYLKVFLEKKYKDQGKEMFLSFAEGSISKLEDIINSDQFTHLRDISLEITKNILDLNIEKMIDIEKTVLDNKTEFETILDILILWYRDIELIKNGMKDNYIINKDKVEELNDQCGKISFKVLKRIIENLYIVKNSLKSNVNPKIAINVMLLNIKG